MSVSAEQARALYVGTVSWDDVANRINGVIASEVAALQRELAMSLYRQSDAEENAALILHARLADSTTSLGPPSGDLERAAKAADERAAICRAAAQEYAGGASELGEQVCLSNAAIAENIAADIRALAPLTEKP